MSIGAAERKEEIFKESTKHKAQVALKKTLAAYFENPIHYLFYTVLPMTAVGLFFNMEFPVMYYILFGLIAIAKAAQAINASEASIEDRVNVQVTAAIKKDGTNDNNSHAAV